MLTYCFDLDGTLCSNTEGLYEEAEPFFDAIKAVNQLYNAGHTIIIQTARGFTTGIDWRDVTESQLKGWGLHYHELHFNKVSANVYIDDKAVNAYRWIETKSDPKDLLLSGK